MRLWAYQKHVRQRLTTRQHRFGVQGQRPGAGVPGAGGGPLQKLARRAAPHPNGYQTACGDSGCSAGNLTNDGTASSTYDALSRTTVRGSTTYASNGDGTLVDDAPPITRHPSPVSLFVQCSTM